jgi:Uma2 family endonuclease
LAEVRSAAHNTITLNIARHLHAKARSGGCRIFASDIKVRIKNAVFYPDVMVVCSDLDQDPYVMQNPCLIIEVQSPSTARFDLDIKLQHYRKIASLKAYLIVSQERRSVNIFRRAGDLWTLESVEEHGSIALECPETTLTLDQIYEDLELASGELE